VRPRHPRRQIRPRPAVARWFAADARDVTRIALSPVRPTRVAASVASGIAGWQRSIERRRLLALGRRGAIVGLLAACLLQVVAVLAGHAGFGPWLWPALGISLVAPLPGALRRTSPSVVARMLDRDLGLGAGMTTALELEQRPESSGGLAALVLADGREALARSRGATRARLRSGRPESGLAAALALVLAGLLLLPALGHGARAHATAGAKALPRTSASASESDPTRQRAGPDLRQFGRDQPALPALDAVPGAARTGAATGGGRPYSGTSGHGGGSVQPASRTVGNAGYLQRPRTSSSSAASSSGDGARGRGSSTLTSHAAPAARQIGSAGSERSTPLSSERAAAGRAAANGIPGRASTRGGSSRGGASAAGANQASAARHATPGGATAGSTKGGANAALGVVPQLTGGKSLPVKAGYETAKGAKGGQGESASATSGAGGASHSGRATGGAGGGGAALPYVAPGGSTVSPVDRRLLLGYFGSFARVSAAGW
jgi:hypothetical protein